MPQISKGKKECVYIHKTSPFHLDQLLYAQFISIQIFILSDFPTIYGGFVKPLLPDQGQYFFLQAVPENEIADQLLLL